VQSIPTHRPRPAVLTIAEVMDVLRIGRTKAYEQARLYLDTNGEDGLPCIKVGDSIRFLRHAIEDLVLRLSSCRSSRSVSVSMWGSLIEPEEAFDEYFTTEEEEAVSGAAGEVRDLDAVGAWRDHDW